MGVMGAADFITAERAFFERGFYNALENDLSKSVLSPVVELLFDGKAGRLSPAVVEEELARLSSNDLRTEASSVLYRLPVTAQYGLSLSGGARHSSSILNFGYNSALSVVRGNSGSRFSLNAQHRYQPVEKLELSVGVFYVRRLGLDNGVGIYDLGTGGYPYARLLDAEGNPAPLVRDFRTSFAAAPGAGLLDWQFRPLQERELRDRSDILQELRGAFGLRYTPVGGLDLSLNYQYQGQWNDQETLYDPQGYYVRNLVNRFTQADGTRIFPMGAILEAQMGRTVSHNLRGQAGYKWNAGKRHAFDVLVGAEAREVVAEQGGYKLFGYDSQVLTFADRLDFVTRYPTRPRLTAQLPTTNVALASLTDRFVSYYASSSYSFLDRYTVSGSARLDGSNLFGVKANQKSVPLWSAGVAWNVEREGFFRVDFIDRLKLRASYGYNGNTNNGITAFTTARYSNDPLTGQRRAEITSPGNPQLRWEKVQIVNLATDFGMFEGRLGGTIEYYVKKGRDLLGRRTYEPTTGIFSPDIRTLVNYAATRTRGLDLSLDYRSMGSGVKWSASLLLSHAKDVVTDYQEQGSLSTIALISNSTVPPAPGRSLNSVYSLPWNGLDAATGDPLVSVGGNLSKDYTSYFQQLKPEHLVYHGRGNPLLTGFLRGGPIYKGLSLSITLSFKTGYYFRRQGMDYSVLFSSGATNADFGSRWKSPGDELLTNVPSIPLALNSNRDAVYTLSELMVERGDHVRFQDANLSYRFNLRGKQRFGIAGLEVYGQGNNLGILYWANRLGLDPDTPLAIYPLSASFTLGLRATLN